MYFCHVNYSNTIRCGCNWNQNIVTRKHFASIDYYLFLDFRGLNSLQVFVFFGDFMALWYLASGRVGILVADVICCTCCTWAVRTVLKCSRVLWKAIHASKVVKFRKSEFWKISMLPVSRSTISQIGTVEIPYGQEPRIETLFFSKRHGFSIFRLQSWSQC